MRSAIYYTVILDIWYMAMYFMVRRPLFNIIVAVKF
jgi:hypothetical protein